jgi:diguanylate cyclase (GGDEF)-like protein/PAS domain S-box-containing protein
MNPSSSSLESCLQTNRRLQRELEQQRRAAEESRQRLVDFIATFSDLIWETDADSRIIGTHLPKDVTSMSEQNGLFLGKTIAQIADASSASDPLFAVHLEDLEARKPFRNFVCAIQRPDGGLMWTESNGIPVFDENGEFQGYRGTTRDVTARKEHEARIAFMARHDALTGLPDRVLFRERLDQALASTTERDGVAVLYLDLDGFKTVNDTLGPAAGDSLLRTVAERLRRCAWNSATVGRLSGDEFAIVQHGLESPEVEALLMARRILQVVAEPCDFDGERASVTVTIGIAFASRGESADQVLKNADIALCEAKRNQRGTYLRFDPEMGRRFDAKGLLEIELRSALANREFELAWQPFHNAKTSKITAFEALLRWRHPRRGMVLPDEFIPLAEETGLIVPIGEWVLREACAEAKHWPSDINIAVNLSPVQFRSPKLLAVVADALAVSGLPAFRLELEITETALMQRDENSLRTLESLHALGAAISLDGFGTGYSSFEYLRKFAFDKIKIARPFIQELTQAGSTTAVFHAIASLGASLRLTTTAEGVETLEQFAIVQAEGCTEVQGYLFSTPRPASEFPMLRGPRDGWREWMDSMPLPDSSLQSLAVHVAGNSYVFESQAV